jgi:hypothetical protein
MLPEAVMSDDYDWDFAGADDARITIHAAVRHLLKNAAGTNRGDIVSEIIEIVRQAAQGEPPNQTSPLDDPPGG